MKNNLKALVLQGKQDAADLTKVLEEMEKLAEEGHEAEARALGNEFVLMAKKFEVSRYEMMRSCGDPAVRAQFEKVHEDAHPVQIGFTEEGWFALYMDPLARTAKAACKEWSRVIVNPAMAKFFADKDTVRIPKCTVIFRHVYDRDDPRAGLRDYDNVEVKQITDTVAMYVMVDDNPRCCCSIHCSAPGTTPHTEVYVIPQEDNLKWIEMEPNIPDGGMPLTDRVPEAWKVTM